MDSTRSSVKKSKDKINIYARGKQSSWNESYLAAKIGMECNHSYGGFTVCMGWGDFKKEVVFYYNLFCSSDKNSNCYINRTIKLVYVFFIVLSFGICMFDM